MSRLDFIKKVSTLWHAMTTDRESDLHARVPRHVRAALERIASERGERLSVIVREAVSGYVARQRAVEEAAEPYQFSKDTSKKPRKVS